MRERDLFTQTFQCLVVKPSSIHGFGCFSSMNIPPGPTIVEYTGEHINLEEAVCRNNPSSKAFSPYILEVFENLFIDGRWHGNASRFMNHSCDPNCRIRRIKRRAFIVASRPIFPGEELTIDYCFDEDQHEPCYCGARGCRGFI